MRKWVSGKGIPVPTGLKTAALKYDFDKLDAGQTPTAKDKTFDRKRFMQEKITKYNEACQMWNEMDKSKRARLAV